MLDAFALCELTKSLLSLCITHHEPSFRDSASGKKEQKEEYYQ